MERFALSPRNKGFDDGAKRDGLFDPRRDYQPDERAAYEAGFEAGRAAKISQRR